MPPSFSTQSTQIKPFSNCSGIVNTRITCETPKQPSTPSSSSSSSSSSSMYATGGYSSGVNMGAGMIRPM